jgi:rod shape-determining protein MreC
VAVRRPSRSRFVLVLLVLTAGTIITLGYRSQADRYTSKLTSYASDVFSPVQSGVLDAVRPVANFFRGAVDYASLRRQNAELRHQLATNANQVAAARDEARQLAALARLEHLPFAGSLPGIPTEVSDTSFSNFELTVQLDRGAEAGIRVGMTAVSGYGLVGRVIQTARYRSVVLLITDPTSNVGVRDGSTVGVAAGQGQGDPLRVDYIFPPAQGLAKGQVMVTSGLQGSLYPPGIPVGRISTLTHRPGGLQEDVQLAPVVNFSQLQFVEVLEWDSQTASALPASGPGQS